MCSYNGNTVFFHQWLGHKKKTGNGGKKVKFLEEIYPTHKIDELELMAELSTDKDLKDLGRRHGMDEATLAKKLK
jgi:hypothetical protein